MVEIEIMLESLFVLDSVLDLECKLLELRLEVLLMYSGDSYAAHELTQFSLEPLSLGSELSLLL